MTVPRWLAALVVATGLLAMHGLTASTASAAAPCGTVSAHDHGAAAATGSYPEGPSSGVATSSSTSSGSLGHLGALCLAVLMAGLILVLLRQRARAGDRSPGCRGVTPASGVSSRPPPVPRLSLLCSWRT